tara:strand:- start:590 stop:778 length:189 start_codon:yes stop_codon:yes gene_type:complete
MVVGAKKKELERARSSPSYQSRPLSLPPLGQDSDVLNDETEYLEEEEEVEGSTPQRPLIGTR